MTAAPKRRWFQFSLRTLFVVVTLFGFFLAWLARAAIVVRERQELLQPSLSYSLDAPEWPRPISWRIVAFIFGYRQGSYYWDGISVHDRSDEEMKRLRRAFPEARISVDETWPQNMPIPEYRKHPPSWW
jgi:hypothetical protein